MSSIMMLDIMMLDMNRYDKWVHERIKSHGEFQGGPGI